MPRSLGSSVTQANGNGQAGFDARESSKDQRTTGASAAGASVVSILPRCYGFPPVERSPRTAARDAETPRSFVQRA